LPGPPGDCGRPTASEKLSELFHRQAGILNNSAHGDGDLDLTDLGSFGRFHVRVEIFLDGHSDIRQSFLDRFPLRPAPGKERAETATPSSDG
jgi:hypothetical protein